MPIERVDLSDSSSSLSRAFRLLLLAKEAAERKMAKTPNYQFVAASSSIILEVLAKKLRLENWLMGQDRE
jgi:hypothetical protein